MIWPILSFLLFSGIAFWLGYDKYDEYPIWRGIKGMLFMWMLIAVLITTIKTLMWVGGT